MFLLSFVKNRLPHLYADFAAFFYIAYSVLLCQDNGNDCFKKYVHVAALLVILKFIIFQMYNSPMFTDSATYYEN